MFKMNKITGRTKASKDPRTKLREQATLTLKGEGYEYLSPIGSGTFGEVIACRRHQGKVAVKIVASEMVTAGESEFWSRFIHPNILPLLKIIVLPDCDLFVMPLYKKSMIGLLRNKRFRRKSTGFKFTISLLRDILLGLEYLHNNHVCHLDLKADNILVTAKMKSVICDFSCLDTTEKRVGRYGLPHYFRPPEACLKVSQSIMVEGIPFDVWSFGMMALHTWTFEWFQSTLHDLKYNWDEYVYPLLFQALQMPFFGKLLKSTFPRTSIIPEETGLALNLIHGTMRYRPKDRPTVASILKHHLFSEHMECTLLKPDHIWCSPSIAKCIRSPDDAGTFEHTWEGS